MTESPVSQTFYFSRVFRRAYDDTGPILLTLTTVGYLVIAYLALEENWKGWDTIAGVSTIAFAIVCLNALTRATYKLWREQAEKLNDLLAVPDVTVQVREPFTGRDWLIRLEVSHTGATKRSLCAQVVRVEGMADGGPEWPWWIHWRHTWHRVTELMPNVPEMLLIGGTWGNRIRFEVIDRDGEAIKDAEYGHYVADQIVIEVIMWDAATGIVVDHREISVGQSTDTARPPTIDVTELPH